MEPVAKKREDEWIIQMMDGKRKEECLDLEGSLVHRDSKGWDYRVLV